MKPTLLLTIIMACFSINYASGQSKFDLLTTALETYKSNPAENSDAVLIKNMASINTPYLEYSPVVHRNGVVFSSNRPRKGNFFSKIFSHINSNIYYTAEDGEDFYFSPIELLGKVNTSSHEGSSTFNLSNNTMIYTCNCKKKNAQGLYDLQLCTAKFESGKWKKTEDLTFNGSYRSCHPTLSADGTLLIFSARRPEGYGGMDLYYSKFVEGVWQKPENLGSAVNTSKDEVFPNLTAEGVLVFSSNGLPGRGGLDLFYSKPLANDEWAKATSFGEPINSKKDDFGFLSFEDGTKGMFASNRTGGKGMDDIYSWQIQINETPEKEAAVLTTNLMILDEFTGIALQESQINLIEIDRNALQTGQIKEEVLISNTVNPSLVSLLGNKIDPIISLENENKYSYPIKLNHDYFLQVNQDGYNTLQKIVSSEHLLKEAAYAIVLNPEKGIRLDNIATVEEATEDVIIPPVTIDNPVVAGMVIIDKIEAEEKAPEKTIETPTTIAKEEVFTSRGIPADMIKGAEAVSAKASPKLKKIISLDNIYYEFNKYELTNVSKDALNEVVALLRNDESINIVVKSHTDARGKKSFNKWLSQMRAAAVKEYIIAEGIAANRIKAIGMGEEQLLNNCGDNTPCNEENHKLNRRTEFIIEQEK